MVLLQERGDAHERAYLERLRAERSERSDEIDRTATCARPTSFGRPRRRRSTAMRRGVDVIYQATFFDGRWRGHADFLLRVERPSDLGVDYEVADTKLARSVKAGAILQVCVYADRLRRSRASRRSGSTS